jgi:hypothetical protein
MVSSISSIPYGKVAVAGFLRLEKIEGFKVRKGAVSKNAITV